jgi:glycosyltransferase involved in cell wall biosynthesis
VPSNHRAMVADDLAAVCRELPQLEVRGLDWRRLEVDEARVVAAAAGVEVDRWISTGYQVPSDGGRDFRDCRFWLFVSDRLELPLVPLERYGVVVTDHLQRYVPEIFGANMYAMADAAPWNFLRNVRNADVVVATSADTAADVLSYAGARGRLVRMSTTLDVDHFIKLADAAAAASSEDAAWPGSEPFLAWVTNTAVHKNHLRMLRALERYAGELGGSLNVLVTGIGTDLFDPELPAERRVGREFLWDLPYVRAVRDTVAAVDPALRRRLRFLGSVPDVGYVRLLKSATFVAHNVLADNGTYSVVEAALLGRPSISSDYPQMREIDSAFGLGLRFFDPFDEQSTAAALHAGETLPPPPAAVGRRIRERTWRSWDDGLVESIRHAIVTPRSRIACL